MRPNIETIEKLARGLGIPKDEFMASVGYIDAPPIMISDPGEYIPSPNAGGPSNVLIPGHELREFQSNNLILVPVLGRVRGGEPLYADGDIEGYFPVDTSVSGISVSDELFYLRVVGDSMTPKYQPGDLVLVRKQPIVDNGQVAVVIVNGNEGCIKKVYYTDGDVWLHSTNPSYDPMQYPARDVFIVGLVLGRWG